MKRERNSLGWEDGSAGKGAHHQAEDLSSIPRVHVVGGYKKNHCELSSDLHAHHMCVHTHKK